MVQLRGAIVRAQKSEDLMYNDMEIGDRSASDIGSTSSASSRCQLRFDNQERSMVGKDS